ncbi:MAG: TM2 domain-containing protein [Ktedonobacterales bacterium]
MYVQDRSQRSWLVTFLLCVFFGIFGVHRFYAGNIGTGLVQLFTGGGLGIWWLIDLIMIALGAFRDDQGLPVRP